MNDKKPGTSLRLWWTRRQDVQGAEDLGKNCFPLLMHRELPTQPPGPGEVRTEVDNRREGALGTAGGSVPQCTLTLCQEECEAGRGKDLASAAELVHSRAGLGARVFSSTLHSYAWPATLVIIIEHVPYCPLGSLLEGLTCANMGGTIPVTLKCISLDLGNKR